MNDSRDNKSAPLPRAGVRFMIFTVVVLLAVAIYANIQRARRDKIESVTIVPAAATPVPQRQ